MRRSWKKESKSAIVKVENVKIEQKEVIWKVNGVKKIEHLYSVITGSDSNFWAFLLLLSKLQEHCRVFLHAMKLSFHEFLITKGTLAETLPKTSWIAFICMVCLSLWVYKFGFMAKQAGLHLSAWLLPDYKWNEKPNKWSRQHLKL